MKVLLTSNWGVSTSIMDSKIQKIVRKLTDNPDPYYKAKKQYNQVAMGMYSYLEQLVNKADDPLYTAIKMVIAGNIIDFRAKEKFDLK